MNIGTLEPAQTDQLEIVLRHIVPIFLCQIRFEFQSKQNIPKHGQPREQCRFLEHHESFTTWPRDRSAIGTHRSAVGFFQTGNHIEQCSFAAAAGADKTDEFSLSNTETHLVQSEN